MSLISEWMSLSYGFGAFAAGLLWQGNADAEGGHDGGAAIEAVVEVLSSLFGSLWLASLGMVVSPVFLWDHLGVIISFVAVVLSLKGVVAAAVMHLYYGFPKRVAFSAGTTLGHVSTV